MLIYIVLDLLQAITSADIIYPYLFLWESLGTSYPFWYVSVSTSMCDTRLYIKGMNTPSVSGSGSGSVSVSGKVTIDLYLPLGLPLGNRSQTHSKRQPKRQIQVNGDLAATADARCVHSLKEIFTN